MNYKVVGNDVLLKNIDNFILSQTLECGQCFRFNKINDEHYVVVAFRKIVVIKQDDCNTIFFDTTEEDFLSIWCPYFDFDRNYAEIIDKICFDDDVMKDAVSFAPGIRILNQEFFECLISFIISQNNRIPMIKTVIKNISEMFGTYLGEVDDEKYYAFPTKDELFLANEEQLMLCKTGFRAKYILDAVKNIDDNVVDFSKFDDLNTEQLRNNLMLVKGVGPKVSDCVMLFSCGRHEVFPTDVWVKRIMTHYYYADVETSIKEIHKKSVLLFAENAGFAQQYLFNYARENLK